MMARSLYAWTSVAIVVMVSVSVQAQPVDLELLARQAADYEAHIGRMQAQRLDSDLHFAQLRPLLPESVRQHVSGSQIETPGELLLAWWRRQDPLPASPANERVIEHLRRVAYAEENFACADCVTGFDARGEVYVRYGAPERATEITFDDPLLIDAIYQPGMAVSPGDFPDNVFWRYLNVDRDAYFLFIRDRNRYRLGETSDLLPPSLRSGFQPGGRGLVKSQMALAVLRSVYRQLALEHPHFGARFNDVDLWLSARESTGRLQSQDLTDNVRVLTGADLISGAERSEGAEVSAYTSQPAHEFAQTLLSTARIEDQQVAYQQETLLPRVFSDVGRTLPGIQIAVRHARFLSRDGLTRTEVYWGLEPGAAHPSGAAPQNEYLLQLHARQLNADYTIRQDSSKVIRILGVEHGPDSVIPPQSFALEGDASAYHLAFQWDQYRVTPNGRERIRAEARWIDSLQALDATGMALEMSDLKPVHHVSEETAWPYPYAEVAGDTELGLYFEVYHLSLDPSGETRYTITYEITPRDGRRASSVTSSYRGESRTAREDISLDLSGWSGEVQVEVIVVDDVSGVSVSRAVEFTLIG